MRGPWTHWAASSQLSHFRLPLHDAGTGLTGSPLGRVIRGNQFVLDPFDAYRAGIVTSPNVAVIGSIGAGKSSVVKMMVARGLRRHRSAVILDPKGEYQELATACDGAVVRLGSNSWWNPFGDSESDNLNFLTALVSTARGEHLSDVERATLEQVWTSGCCSQNARPMERLWRSCSSVDDAMAATVRRFVAGDLAGLIDGPGPALTTTAALLVLDMSQWWLSESLAVAALVGWNMANHRLADPLVPGYLVIDEAWALLQNEFATTWLQGAWKLARARGIANVAVVHRLLDADGAGDLGSVSRSRAVGLIRDCSTFFMFRHAEGDLGTVRETIGLSALESQYLVALPRGSALVRYGAWSSVVQLEPTVED
ncbi:MAG: DUF87 domain-containing protein, partial [Actinomycetes bacterium]